VFLKRKISDSLPSFTEFNIPEENITHEQLRITTLRKTRSARYLGECLGDDGLHGLEIRHCFGDEFIHLEECLISANELCCTGIEFVECSELSSENFDAGTKMLDVIRMELSVECGEHSTEVDRHLHQLALDGDDLVADGNDLLDVSVHRAIRTSG